MTPKLTVQEYPTELNTTYIFSRKMVLDQPKTIMGQLHRVSAQHGNKRDTTHSMGQMHKVTAQQERHHTIHMSYASGHNSVEIVIRQIRGHKATLKLRFGNP